MLMGPSMLLLVGILGIYFGAVLQMLSHGLITALFFALIGMIYGRSGTRLITGMGFFKVSLVPFHLWTADVYEGAPTNVTSYF